MGYEISYPRNRVLLNYLNLNVLILHPSGMAKTKESKRKVFVSLLTIFINYIE